MREACEGPVAIPYCALCHLAGAAAAPKEMVGALTPTFVKPASIKAALSDLAQADLDELFFQ